MKKLSENKVDFRQLITFKNNLFSSPHLSKDNTIPVFEFKRVKQEIEFADIRNDIKQTEEIILKECCVEQGIVDLNVFSDIVDLFVYFPVRQSKVSSESHDIQDVLQYNKTKVCTFDGDI